ncbi:YqcC family protein [uncultured Paraglaciecola sp.]|uniref:YqcC family protein n=1 Tax=uncultured Paraglaciecola sp. TaxID=1765024 RepID=UPI002608D521|nr:YqcC family protein [uncultured Paraglaciecola sp.]
MPCSHKEVEILLKKLQQSLQEAKLWSNVVPPSKALQSLLPFAVDTLSFEQWLQFIFIPKMRELINTEPHLPKNLKLLPMAEQSFQSKEEQLGVMEVIRQIDLAFAVL